VHILFGLFFGYRGNEPTSSWQVSVFTFRCFVCRSVHCGF